MRRLKIKTKLIPILVIIFLFVLGVPVTAFAHGVKVTYKTKSAVEIRATYDTGKPLSEGQVTIFAPDNPSKPWSKGKTDKNGYFTFAPDYSKPGTWDVQVRRAGHGGMIHIPVEKGTATSQSESTGFSWWQIVLMAVCVVWGLVGTALFFSRRKS